MRKMRTLNDSTVFVGSAREIKSLWNALMQRSEELQVKPSHCGEPKMRKSGSYGLEIMDEPEGLSAYRTVYIVKSDTLIRWLAEEILC